ncbi:hypothetical protein JN11_01020 [Mucilaginibacter frigoritolerans]|uniref:Uncharacterized protein n=1 Tax=Mucilaginibacter frigoritolerans TaxID=652788 RepID=A0A562UDE3_9SPHI|nr:hypothetical protein [Mucilaginibacter frigoritolerans]TWJ03477.1 hypothetical protein JN11_01020 [Mucilaginibacter frigoritolerans]
MKRKYNYFDIGIFITLLLIVVGVFYKDIDGSFFYTLNDFLDVVLLIFSLRIIFGKPGVERYLVIVLLFVCLFNLLTFTYMVDGAKYSSRSWIKIGHLGFNPFTFLLLIIYAFIDRKYLSYLFGNIFYGSKEEQENKKEKLINFYYDKFNNCTSEELSKILDDFELYPVEAQIALNKIKEEKVIV